MKISTNSRYALRFLTRLALMSNENRVTTMEIASAEGISEKMLERIAAKLQRNGFILSARGCAGGYILAKKPEEILMSDIMLLMETNFLPIHCSDNPQDCLRHDNCIFAKVFEQLSDNILSMASSISLADILSGQAISDVSMS